jgi:hypothetical protein
MTSLATGDHVGVPQQAGAASAVVVNPSKVADLDAHRAEICAALAAAGWPEPLWLPTTPEDPGCGMAQHAVRYAPSSRRTGVARSGFTAIEGVAPASVALRA